MFSWWSNNKNIERYTLGMPGNDCGQIIAEKCAQADFAAVSELFQALIAIEHFDFEAAPSALNDETLFAYAVRDGRLASALAAGAI
jgi:hypothetical protein